MAYNRRDIFGHWIRLKQKAERPCTHACCRGWQAHPTNSAVILPDKTLRRASDDDLAERYSRLSARIDEDARKGEAQILHEMERRDAAEARRMERETRARTYREMVSANQAAKRQEREAEYERIRLDAEANTSGYLVNAKGRARGIHDIEILTGRTDVFERYASDEAKDYFAANPRPTAAYLIRGENTRYVPRATARKRKRRGVTVHR